MARRIWERPSSNSTVAAGCSTPGSPMIASGANRCMRVNRLGRSTAYSTYARPVCNSQSTGGPLMDCQRVASSS